MTKEKILEEYNKEKKFAIAGNNLYEVEDVYFDLLCNHFSRRLERCLTFIKEYNELADQYKKSNKSLSSPEFREERDALIDDLDKREENGEFNLTEEHKKILQFLENFYFKNLETNIHTKQLQIEDEKVIVPKDQIYHVCNLTSLSQFKSYADLGIVPTEWFGVFESQWEGRFCAFVKNDCSKRKIGGEDLSETFVKFYIDNTNPLWKMLSSLDYFEYEHLKETSPEKIKNYYPKEIIDLYEQIVEPLSGSGKKMHSNPIFPTFTWQAIPGGIPPQLIVGIQIKSKNEEFMKNLTNIQNLFPNAVIFDETHKVLSNQKQKTNQLTL